MLARLLTVIVLFLIPLNAAAHAFQQEGRKKVLVLFAFRPTLAVSIQYDRGIRTVLEASNNPPTVLNIEFMDLTHFNDEAHYRMLREVYRLKYADPQPDLIIAVVETAVDFVLKYREELFPGVPIVFGGIEGAFVENRSLGSNITGLLTGISFQATLDLALDLHPDTRTVVVYAGTSPIAQSIGQSCREAYAPYGNRVQFTYLFGLKMETLLEKMAALPDHTVAIHLPFWRDGAGKEFVGNQALSRVARTANAPVYTFWKAAMGTGTIGGHMNSLEREAEAVARLGLRVLNGEKPDNIPVRPAPSFRYMFDGRQLKRWSISEKQLPPDSIVMFKDITIWGQYKLRIIGIMALIGAQAMVIVLLLKHRRRNRRTEFELKKRLQFENKLSEMSSEFINLSPSDFNATVNRALAWVGPFMHADRSHMFQFNWNRTEFRISHLWQADGIPNDEVVLPGLMVKDTFPWLFENLTEGTEVLVPDVELLPALAAASEYRYCRQMGIQSFIILPIQIENAPLCAIGLDFIRVKRNWPRILQDRLKIMGEIIANAIVRRHAEEISAQAALRYRTVADFTYDWEYWQRPDGTMAYISPSCERICGYRAQDLMANPALLEEMIIPEDRTAWQAHRSSAKEALATDASAAMDIQFRIQRADGEIRWIEHVCQPVFDTNGINQGVRASNRDITKRKQYKSETRELQSELAHMDRVVTINVLTSALAHEINQPLAAMRSYAQAALRFMDRDRPDNANIEKALKGIVADNKRAAEVVNRLRDLVKKKTPHRKIIEIHRLINEVLRLINSEIVIKNTRVTTRLHPAPLEFYGDPVQIQQVLINILANALDAMADIPMDKRMLTIATKSQDDGHLRVSIADTGEGIPPANIKAIFAPFHTTKPKGMGLGLGICKTIVESHGGSMWAENNTDGGATFVIILPAQSKVESP